MVASYVVHRKTIHALDRMDDTIACNMTATQDILERKNVAAY